ncbi:AmmeMemoRadiSam system protein B [Halosegnis sp.]|uniref:AmmeMemoRadiSam system protein B n=1 Tax=Halosegnis sp. TaxID=2864959 RepID=UPI0035D4D6E6
MPTLPDELDHAAGERLVALARETVERVAAGEPPGTPDRRVPALDAACGVFVTLERDDQLRGCIGRPDPDQPLRETVVEAATDAAVNDPRLPPVRTDEPPRLTVTVTVLSTFIPVDGTEPAERVEAVEVGRDGLVVELGRRRGLLLPQVAVDNGWDARQFLAETCRKAGLADDAWRRESTTIKRFTARAFTQPPDERLRVRRFDADREAAADGGRSRTVDERPPAVAGRFYAGDESALREQVADCFAHEYGPGQPATVAPDERPVGVVAPHAGYQFSGPVAAHAHAQFAADPPDTVVVLGPNHDGTGPPAAVAPHDRWRTPLGTVDVDATLADRLAETDAATFHARSHAGEHSLEVQIPFLQHCCGSVSVVPVCLTRAGTERAEALGRAVADAAASVDQSVGLVVSTDLTHYAPHEAAVAADEPVVEAVATLDVDGVTAAIADGHSMCGPWATVAGLTAAKRLGAETGDRLQYATSADTSGRRDGVVGYCAVALR